MPFPLREFRPVAARAHSLRALGAGAVLAALGTVACQGRGDARRSAEGAEAASEGTSAAAVPAPPDDRPPADGPPRMTNADPPFRYPAALYAQKVQGNVTLRLWVDSAGAVLPDSTRVTEPSGYPALDSSAVAGSEKLRFAPGIRDGRPTGAAILFPVYFRHPEAAPLPGDTVLRAPRP